VGRVFGNIHCVGAMGCYTVGARIMPRDEKIFTVDETRCWPSYPLASRPVQISLAGVGRLPRDGHVP
jgi:hypothetical protein